MKKILVALALLVICLTAVVKCVKNTSKVEEKATKVETSPIIIKDDKDVEAPSPAIIYKDNNIAPAADTIIAPAADTINNNEYNKHKKSLSVAAKKALYESLSDDKKQELRKEVQRHMAVRKKIKGTDEDGHEQLSEEDQVKMLKEKKRHRDEVEKITGVRVGIKLKDIE